MRPDDREYLLRANSNWPWVLVPLMGMVFVLGVGRMPSGDGTGLSPYGPSPQAVSSASPFPSHFARGEQP